MGSAFKDTLKNIQYIDIDMNKRDLKTFKEKTLVSSIDMNKRDFNKGAFKDT